MLTFSGVRDFHPEHTFDCGQCFRWNRQADGSYIGVAQGKIVQAHYDPETFVLQLEGTSTSADEGLWWDYFDLDRDYEAIKAYLTQEDEIMKEAIPSCYGMRILHQDPWETLISFILSQNNNISRIKKCVESLCTSFGPLVGEYRGELYYGFPEPEVLALLTEADLAHCRLGYRAKYILGTAAAVAADQKRMLTDIAQASSEEVHEYLQSLCGVGPKVANCISLFSMRKTASFPLDVWIKRVMHQLYGISAGDTKAMAAYAQEHFGEYGGIAQQYLFHYIRQKDRQPAADLAEVKGK